MRKQGVQFFAKRDVRLVTGHVETHMQELVSLLLDGLHHRRRAMTRVHHTDTSCEIDQFVAIGIRDDALPWHDLRWRN